MPSISIRRDCILNFFPPIYGIKVFESIKKQLAPKQVYREKIPELFLVQEIKTVYCSKCAVHTRECVCVVFHLFSSFSAAELNVVRAFVLISACWTIFTMIPAAAATVIQKYVLSVAACVSAFLQGGWNVANLITNNFCVCVLILNFKIWSTK